MPRRYLDRPGSTGGDELSENYRDWRTGFFMCIRLRSKKGSIRTYALSTTVLAQLNEYDRTRSFPISPWTPPCGPLLDLGWVSRLHLRNLDAISVRYRCG